MSAPGKRLPAKRKTGAVALRERLDSKQIAGHALQCALAGNDSPTIVDLAKAYCKANAKLPFAEAREKVAQLLPRTVAVLFQTFQTPACLVSDLFYQPQLDRRAYFEDPPRDIATARRCLPTVKNPRAGVHMGRDSLVVAVALSHNLRSSHDKMLRNRERLQIMIDGGGLPADEVQKLLGKPDLAAV